MYPMASHGIHGKVCYSFAYRPEVARPHFLARTARLLGCEPHLHYKRLIEGETIELDDGTIVTPDMVMSKPSSA